MRQRGEPVLRDERNARRIIYPAGGARAPCGTTPAGDARAKWYLLISFRDSRRFFVVLKEKGQIPHVSTTTRELSKQKQWVFHEYVHKPRDTKKKQGGKTKKVFSALALILKTTFCVCIARFRAVYTVTADPSMAWT